MNISDPARKEQETKEAYPGRLRALLEKNVNAALPTAEYHEAVQLIFFLGESEQFCRFCQKRGMRDAARILEGLHVCKGCATVSLSQRILFE